MLKLCEACCKIKFSNKVFKVHALILLKPTFLCYLRTASLIWLCVEQRVKLSFYYDESKCQKQLKSPIATTCNYGESFVEVGTRDYKDNDYDNANAITRCECMYWNAKDSKGIAAWSVD